VNIPSLHTPTSIHEQVPIIRDHNHYTGYTPSSKKSKRSLLFGSPSTKQKVDESHHYQQQSMDLQKEM
jgi:hypothetical protein